ncbi:hypothetical protein CWM58_12385 [Klebsiella sp. H-Nf2]|nr:hypothetical protein CWM58_12385 [Klebsiella sp. H-Nf2]
MGGHITQFINQPEAAIQALCRQKPTVGGQLTERGFALPPPRDKAGASVLVTTNSVLNKE